MRYTKVVSGAAFSVSLLLAGCGGGDNTHPYDGTWEAVYPTADVSVISDTKVVVCSTPAAVLVVNKSTGTTTQNTTCTTTLITPATPTTPATSVTYPPQTTYYNISVHIEPSAVSGEKDVMNAVVNGITLTGQCISTAACAAVSAAGDKLGITR